MLLKNWLVVELAQRRDATVDPVLRRLVRRNVKHNDEISGVTGCRESAASCARLVHQAFVARLVLKLLHLTWLHQDDWKGVIDDIGQRFIEHHSVSVPACTFDEQPLTRADDT